MSTLYDLTVRRLDGSETTLTDWRGKVLLIVNTASQCGFTPQYAGLESLYKKYRDRGFAVLGFPCNQFGAQEPGTAEDIGAFCEKNFGVSFPMFDKVDVNGPNAHPLFVQLKQQAPGILGTDGIKWNFTKFIVDRQGKVINRYAPTTSPNALDSDVLQLLDNS